MTQRSADVITGGADRVVVVGEALIDLVVRADGTIQATPGGGPFTTARAVARLGRRCSYLGRLSSDAPGNRLRRLLIEDGVTVVLDEPVDEPTTLASAGLDDHGDATYRFYLEGTSAVGLTPADAALVDWADVGALHAGSLGLAVEPLRSTVAALLGAVPPSVVVMVDLNCRPAAAVDPGRYRAQVREAAARATLVKASVEDLDFLFPDRPAEEAATALGSPVAVLTDGGTPVRVVGGGECLVVPVPTVTVVDTIGAGDSFGGALLDALLRSPSTPKADGAPELSAALVAAAVADAAVVAAYSCTRAGADPPRAAELAAFRASLR